jgi:hypothetical protein
MIESYVYPTICFESGIIEKALNDNRYALRYVFLEERAGVDRCIDTIQSFKLESFRHSEMQETQMGSCVALCSRYERLDISTESSPSAVYTVSTCHILSLLSTLIKFKPTAQANFLDHSTYIVRR